MRFSALLAISTLACAFASNAHAAEYHFTFFSGSTETASGTFGFDNALLGGTVDQSQLTSFAFSFDGHSFDLNAITNNLPTAYGEQLYFDTATDEFIDVPIRPNISVVVAGSQTGTFPRFAFQIDSALGYDYHYPPPTPVPPPFYTVLLGHFPEGSTSLGDMVYDSVSGLGTQLVISRVDVPEPASFGVLAAGLLMLLIFIRRWPNTDRPTIR